MNVLHCRSAVLFGLALFAALPVFALPEPPLTDAEKTGIRYMREEEKLARDAYTVFSDRWGDPVFDQIAGSEQRHTDAVQSLIERYGLADPVEDEDRRGGFQNPTLAALYDSLTARGSRSRIEALRAAAAIEEIDILDLQRELDRNVRNSDVRFVYENLLRASRNHLRAFTRNLERLGDSYQPRFLAGTQYEAIISGGMEPGGRGRGGRGMGRMGR